MAEAEELKLLLKQLFESQKLAVLATHNQGQPYASLVAFAATPDLKHLVFATTRATRKFSNLTADSRVAMLVDTRTNQDSDIRSAMAATATGTAEEVHDPVREVLREIYLEKHPHLKDFLHSPTCALLRIKVDTYYLVRRFQKVVEIHVTP